MAKFYLGLDLGGTNVKAGVVDEAGGMVGQVSLPTGASPEDLGPAQVIQRMVEAGYQAIKNAGLSRREVAAVGVLSPGQASLGRGIVYRSANLPLWRNVALRKKVSQGLGLRAVLENDANAAAYGEWWAGAGGVAGMKPASDRQKPGNSSSKPAGSSMTPLNSLFMFTLGTGVGGGLVYEGKVVRGSFDFGTEVGHWIMIPDGELCGCGQRGCLERYCSAKYTAERASRKLAKSPALRKKSSLGEVFEKTGKQGGTGGGVGGITSADIVVHAKAGDAFAMEIWDETCRMLALACINVCHFIDPEMIVLAGGMSQAGRFLLDRVNHHVKQQWWQMTKPTARIALARLGNDAGVIGAAGVAKEAEERGVLPAVGE